MLFTASHRDKKPVRFMVCSKNGQSCIAVNPSTEKASCFLGVITPLCSVREEVSVSTNNPNNSHKTQGFKHVQYCFRPSHKASSLSRLSPSAPLLPVPLEVLLPSFSMSDDLPNFSPTSSDDHGQSPSMRVTRSTLESIAARHLFPRKTRIAFSTIAEALASLPERAGAAPFVPARS